MTLEEFKSMVEKVIDERKITATAFGKMFAGDPLFVFQLREGREPREATRQKVLDAIAASNNAEAAA